jgi:hypothetical protein
VRLDGCSASTSHWIASVIASSPRPDGWIAAPPLDARREHVHADQREVGRRLGGFSTSRFTRPSPSSSATP